MSSRSSRKRPGTVLGCRREDHRPRSGVCFLTPFFHPFCAMDSEIIDDEQDVPFPFIDQADDRAVEAMAGAMLGNG